MKGSVCDKPAAQMLKQHFSSPSSFGLSLLRLSQLTVHTVGSTKPTSFPFYGEPQILGMMIFKGSKKTQPLLLTVKMDGCSSERK